MRLGLVWLVVTALFTTACGDDGASPSDAGIDASLEGFTEPDAVCPGAAHCASGDDGTLFVGAAARVFTPEIAETWTDVNGDGEFQNDEPFDDGNGNGEFDAVWLFGGGRAANAVFSDLEARAMVFREGDTTVALIYVDAIGLFGSGGDIELIENDPAVAGAGVDLVIVGSVHAHDAVDTLGLWGPNTFTTGYDADYNAEVRAAAVEAIVAAAGDMHEVEATVASTLTLDVDGDPSSGTDQWTHDIRDPVIYDPTLTVARFTRVDQPGTTVGTLVHWTNHPEMSTFGENNLQISSHFIHWLRLGLENGVPSMPAGGADIPGLGGVTVFAQGPLGGQIGSFRGDVAIPGPDGTPITETGHPKEQALGTNLARRALEVLATDSEVFSDLPVSYRTATINARMENNGLQVAYLIDILAPHAAVGYDADLPLGPGNHPWLPLKLAYFQVGPIGLVTVPGELHPELWVGGYDCQSWSWGYDCYDETKANLPDFAAAPEPPYMRDLVLSNPGVQFPICLGLARDFIGYIVPAYNYALNPNSPYLEEADGDHYEETYSLSPDVERHVVHPILQLLAYRP